MAAIPGQQEWNSEDLKRVRDKTDVLLKQAKILNAAFEAAASTGGFLGGIFQAAQPLTTLLIDIVENQQRLAEQMRQIKPQSPWPPTTSTVHRHRSLT